MSRRSLLRPARSDDLGLRRALSDRLMPALVAAMTFLAALTVAGVLAASAIATHWQSGAAAVLTVQVPRPAEAAGDASRLDRVTAMLRGSPGITAVRVLSAAELAELLRPWLGTGAEASALPLPAVLEVRLAPGEAAPDDGLQARLTAAVPGVFLESQGVWLQRLTTLARSLQACAAAALLLVAAVGAAVIAIATRAGLASRRDAIEIVHGLGATDGFIAGQFAGRATALAASGACLGAVVALPVLLGLATLAQPFLDTAPASSALPTLPAPLWLALPALPLTAAIIGWLTAQATVRRWLRRLP
jgi:cell division transport system permease protein